MPLADEQDSQIVAPDWYDNDIRQFINISPERPKSSHSSSASKLAGNLADGFEYSNQYNAAAKNHNHSFVEETQFETLEKDTQAIETQATGEGLASATSDRLVQHDNTNSTQLQTAKNDEPRTSFFSNPRDNIETRDIASGFKFSAANKPVAGQFNRRVLNVAMNNSADVATISDKTTVTQSSSVECERPPPVPVKMSDKASAAAPVQRIAVPLPQQHGSSGNKPLGTIPPIDRTGNSKTIIVSGLSIASLQQENNPVVHRQEPIVNAGSLGDNSEIKTANLASGSAPQGISTNRQCSRPTKQKSYRVIPDPVHQQESASTHDDESQQAVEKTQPATVFSRHAGTSVPPANLQTHHHVVAVESSLNTPRVAHSATSRPQKHEQYNHGMPITGDSDELSTRGPSKLLPQSEIRNSGGTMQRTSTRGRRAIPFPANNNITNGLPFPEAERQCIHGHKDPGAPTMQSQRVDHPDCHEGAAEWLSPGAKSNTRRVRDRGYEQVDASHDRPRFTSNRPAMGDDKGLDGAHKPLHIPPNIGRDTGCPNQRSNHDEAQIQSFSLVSGTFSKQNKQIHTFAQGSPLTAQAEAFHNHHNHEVRDSKAPSRRADGLSAVDGAIQSKSTNLSINNQVSVQTPQSHLPVTENRPPDMTAKSGWHLARNTLAHGHGEFKEMRNNKFGDGEDNDQRHVETTSMGVNDPEFPDPPPSTGSSPPRLSPKRTDFISRPHSSRSNLGKPMTRPLSEKALQTAEIVDDHGSRPTSGIKKSRGNQTQPAIHRSSSSMSERQRAHPTTELLSDYHKFLANGKQYANMLLDFERQKEIVEAQKREIEELKKSDQTSTQQITKLESERKILDEKVKRLTDHCSKYKNHMNDVVQSQKFLKAKAAEMKQKAKDIFDTHAKAQADGAALLLKLGDVVKEAKEIRAATENQVQHELQERNKQLLLQNERFTKKNKELQDDLSKSELEIKAIVSEKNRLVADNEVLGNAKRKLESLRDKLRSENDNALEENENLKNSLKTADELNKLLDEAINKHLLELSHEKRTTEFLQRQVEGQNKAHKEILDVLKQTPSAVTQELIKGEGILAKITASVTATQIKIDEATSLINNMNSICSEPPPSLIKMIEDLSSRLEDKAQSAGQTRSALQESTNKWVEHLKGSLSQLKLDKETETRLNNRILELLQMNSGLAAEKATIEHNMQSLSKKLDELRSDLEICHSQLSSKSDELSGALAAKKEGSLLKAKVQHLESTNSGLENQLETANQNISILKEEVQALRDESNRKEQQIKDLERKFDSAQAIIKNFGEEQTKFMADKEQEKENACQELVRRAEAHEATVKSKLEAEVQKFEQKQKEKETELSSAKQELLRLQEINSALDSAAKKCQMDLQIFKENFDAHIVHIQRLEERNPGREVSQELSAGLQATRNEVSNLRHQIEFVKNQNTQSYQSLIRDQETIEGRLLAIDVLEKQRDAAENQVTKLKMDIDNRKAAMGRQVLPQTGRIAQSVQGNQVTPVQQAQENDDSILRGFPISKTPEGALRQLTKQVSSDSELQIAPATQNQPLSSFSGASGTPLHNSRTSTTTALVQPLNSTPRQRRLALRKVSNLGPLKEVHSENQWSELLGKASQFQAENSSTHKELRLSNLDLWRSAKTSTPKTSQEPTAMEESCNPLSGIESDRLSLLEDFQNESQSKDAYGQTGSSKTSGNDHSVSLSKGSSGRKISVLIETSTSSAPLKRNHIPPENGFSDEEPSPKKAKTTKISIGDMDTPRHEDLSVAEESRNRRESKPMKSALRKTAVAQHSSRIEANLQLTNEPQHLKSTNKGRQNNTQASVTTRGPSLYKGVVEGRGAKAPGPSSTPFHQTQTLQGKSLARKPTSTNAFSKQTLPQREYGLSLNGAPRQKSRLRVAPIRRPSKSVILDSQEPR